MEQELHFQCDMCGLCCKSVGTSDIYKHFDRGDGTCRYYEDDTRKCSIYAERPLICNVEGYYLEKLQDKMTKEEFFELNYQACARLKAKEK